MPKREASPELIDLSSSSPRHEDKKLAADAVGEGLTWPDVPFHLMRVRGVAPWANEGFLGMKLGDLVTGHMDWVLISNYVRYWSCWSGGIARDEAD